MIDEEKLERKRALNRIACAKYKERHPEKYAEKLAKNKDKTRERWREWSMSHPGARKAISDEWTKNNPEKRKAITKRYYEANKDRLIEKNKEFFIKNPDYRNTWFFDNRERIRAMAAEWRKNNKEWLRSYFHNRRSSTSGHPGITRDRIYQLMFEQNMACKACGANLNETGYHVDHILAISRGGINCDENIQLLCPSCNVRKWAKDNEQFMKEMRG